MVICQLFFLRQTINNYSKNTNQQADKSKCQRPVAIRTHIGNNLNDYNNDNIAAIMEIIVSAFVYFIVLLVFVIHFQVLLLTPG